MTVKILPCPFCGSEIDLEDPDTLYPINRDRTIWNFGCSESTGGCSAYVTGYNKQDAIAIWNKRSNCYEPVADNEEYPNVNPHMKVPKETELEKCVRESFFDRLNKIDMTGNGLEVIAGEL